MKTEQKKTWTAPKLTVYGSVTEITKTEKQFGSGDALAISTDSNNLLQLGSG
jgi:hypothetical protein